MIVVAVTAVRSVELATGRTPGTKVLGRLALPVRHRLTTRTSVSRDRRHRRHPKVAALSPPSTRSLCASARLIEHGSTHPIRTMQDGDRDRHQAMLIMPPTTEFHRAPITEGRPGIVPGASVMLPKLLPVLVDIGRHNSGPATPSGAAR